jgi:hypothetical protein
VTPTQGASGVTVDQAGKLLLELAPALVEQVVKALGSGETPIEIGGSAVVRALVVLEAAIAQLVDGKSLVTVRTGVDDAVVDLLEDLKVGAPPLPL